MRRAAVLTTLTAVSAFTLLFAGALVNANQAALSVPDWPLSYGHLVAPQWSGNIVYEQTHRLLAVITTLLALVSAWMISRDPRLESVRKLSRFATILLLIQVVLGGLVVLWKSPVWLDAVHVVLGLFVAVFLAAVAIKVGTVWSTGQGHVVESEAGERISRRVHLVLLLWFLQLVLGTLSRHPFLGQGAFVVALIGHIIVGLVVVVWVLLLSIGLMRRSTQLPKQRWAAVLLGTVLLQLVIGATVLVVAPEPLNEPWPPPAGFPLAHAGHLALAALLGVGLLGVMLTNKAPATAAHPDGVVR